MADVELSESLEDWVEAGLITDEQADAIRYHESAKHEEDLPGWVEPVAYLGAALVAVALFLFGTQIWDQLAVWGRVSISALITVVLFIVGLVFHRSTSAPAQRAASFSWFLTVAGVAATAGLVFSDVVEVNDDWTGFLTAAVSAAAAIGLYLAAHTTMQQIGVAWTMVFLVVTLAPLLPLGEEAWVVGLLLLAIGVVWMLLTWSSLLTPPAAGWILGSIFSLGVGIGAFDDNALWSGLGIVVGLGLIWLSTRLDRRPLLGLGVLALLIWIPTTVTILFEDTIAIPIAILITGFVTLTAVVAAARVGRRNTPTPVAKE